MEMCALATGLHRVSASRQSRNSQAEHSLVRLRDLRPDVAVGEGEARADRVGRGHIRRAALGREIDGHLLALVRATDGELLAVLVSALNKDLVGADEGDLAGAAGVGIANVKGARPGSPALVRTDPEKQRRSGSHHHSGTGEA